MQTQSIPHHNISGVMPHLAVKAGHLPARTDLLDLAARGALEQKKRGRKMLFTAPPDLADRLKQMETSA